jgi:hypothetical protein
VATAWVRPGGGRDGASLAVLELPEQKPDEIDGWMWFEERADGVELT